MAKPGQSHSPWGENDQIGAMNYGNPGKAGTALPGSDTGENL
jgi:hypothetical protein